MPLFSTVKAIRIVFVLSREAKRLGVEYDDLPAHLVVARMGPKVDPTLWGLVPNTEVSADAVREPALVEALDDVAAGRWEVAAELVADTFGDWNRRYIVVGALAEAAANDDEWLTRWREARPDDGHAAAVHAEGLVMMAWQIRGSARASATTREQFDGFHRVIRQAEEAGQRAVAMAPDDPNPLVTLIIVARALGYSHEDFGQLWKKLVALAPDHRGGHSQALQYWCDKWSGSHELMMEFAVRAAAEFPSLAVLPLEAAREWQYDRDGVWADPAVLAALDALVERLEGEGADTWALLDDRGYAAFALIMVDRYEEAVEQFRLIGSNASRSPWRYFDKPLYDFLLVRAETCLKAGKPKVAR